MAPAARVSELVPGLPRERTWLLRAELGAHAHVTDAVRAAVRLERVPA